MRRLAALLALTATMSGCVAIPIPTPDHPARGMGEVGKPNHSIFAGETTRIEVLHMLGGPDLRTRDGQFMFYLGSDLDVTWIVWTVMGVVDVGGGEFVVLALEFDEGVVVRRSMHSLTAPKQRKHIQRWCEEWAKRETEADWTG